MHHVHDFILLHIFCKRILSVFVCAAFLATKEAGRKSIIYNYIVIFESIRGSFSYNYVFIHNS